MNKTTLRKRLIGTWSWKRPFYSLASIYIILLILTSCGFVNKIIFPAPTPSYDSQTNGLIMLSNDQQQQVAGLYLEGDKGKPILLWSHGNAEDLGLVTPALKYINSNLGYSIFAYDYPGYGLSSGKPNEKGCYRNIQAAWDYLTQTRKINPNNIIIVGQSIGTGPSLWLAEKEPAAALILISPFTSINRIPFGYNIFPIDRFPNIKRIKKLKNPSAPLLILHGENDSIIKQTHGKALFAASPLDSSHKTFIDLKNTGHNDILNNQKFYSAISQFLEKIPQK